jgi:hypothetical protein
LEGTSKMTYDICIMSQIQTEEWSNAAYEECQEHN